MARSPDYHGVSDLNRADQDGNTALHMVMRNFNQEETTAKKVARHLLKNGADPSRKNKIGNTALHQSVQYGQLSAVRFALKHNQFQRRK